MKVAILAPKGDGWGKPAAQGLKRMLAALGVQSKIFFEGYAILEKPYTRVSLSEAALRGWYHNILNLRNA